MRLPALIALFLAACSSSSPGPEPDLAAPADLAMHGHDLGATDLASDGPVSTEDLASLSDLMNDCVGGPSSVNVTVTGNAFFYTFSNASGQNPPLALCKGKTYNFDLVNCASHPFAIKDSIGGALHAGVTNNGASSGTVSLTIATNETASTLAYECTVHGTAMANTITLR